MARPSSWTRENEELLIANFPHMSNEELQQKFFPDRPVRGIESHAKLLGLHKANGRWNPKDDQILIDNFGKMNCIEIREQLLPQWSVATIRQHVKELGLQTREMWSDNELELLRKYYVELETDELIRTHLPNRSYGSILDKAHSLGLFKRPNPREWTAEEEEVLKKYYNIYSVEELIKRFFPDKKKCNINKKKKELGLVVTNKFVNGTFYWTQDRIDLLYNIYPNMNSEEFHYIYFPDISLSAMYAECNKLGIKKSKEFSTGWTDEEIALCREMYLDKDIPVEEICKVCNKKAKQVEYMANVVLGLSRMSVFTDSEIEILKDKYSHMSTEDLVPMMDGKTASQIDRFAHNVLRLYKTKDYIRMATLDGTRNSLQTSSVQSTINNLLDDMGILFEEEYDIEYYLVDCYLTDYNLMIEVQGDFWHCSPLLNKNSVGIKNNVVKDKRKHTYVTNKYNIEILYLWESDVRGNIDLCKMLIETYIQSGGKLDNYHSFNYKTDENGVLTLIDDIHEMPY